jgi:hypothetical protein
MRYVAENFYEKASEGLLFWREAKTFPNLKREYCSYDFKR